MKGDSEGRVRHALAIASERSMALVIHKPGDDSRNRKPCDYMVWWLQGAVWIEVKNAGQAVRLLNLKQQLRPAQRDGIRQAIAIGLPYLLVVWWPRVHLWTISRLDARFVTEQTLFGSVDYADLASKYGIDCNTALLPSVLAEKIREGRVSVSVR